MDFVKFEATGNDFIIIDSRTRDENWARLAQEMCLRHLGVGADGLILLTTSSIADIGMRIFNPDGSEAEVCGNGLRCLAKYVVDRGIVSNLNFSIGTLSGIKKAETSVKMGKVNWVRVDMGVPQFQPEKIPVKVKLIKKKREGIGAPILDYPVRIADRKLSLSFVSMGNPHAVSFILDSVNEFPLAEIGPKVEIYPLFPERINFEIARVVNCQQIEARVWERGAGETPSCGSGASAIAVIAKVKGHIDNEVDIILPGGVLNIQWDGVGKVWLSGPVKEIFSGEWPG